MGAVYRALDTKLSREVAIKVLPEAFASDAERLSRFTREAQVLAALNHPNIAAVYGIEERAIVMELVEGATLADLSVSASMRDGRVQPEMPVTLFKGPANPQGWDVTADGQRFVFAVPKGKMDQAPFTILLNGISRIK